MKGISPIVAAVLLIAITMTIAGVLAYWSANFIGKQLPDTGTETQCKLANFDFLSCKYNSTTGNITFSLVNRRNVELKNLTAFVNYANGSSSSGAILNSTLNIGSDAIKSFSVSGISSDFVSIIVKTQCSDVEASNTCTRN
jgi:flagellin-like protein